MISKLREPFGKAGLIVAVVALVFALGGGAWALTASTGKQHAKTGDLARTSGKNHARGARGPQGPTGPEGPEGPAGINGRNGTNGKNGVDGINGLPGKSVVSGKEPVGENCEQGGYWFEVQGSGSKQYACNGSGESGGTAGGTELGPGDTETGVWSLSGQGQSEYLVPISFPLRVVPRPELMGDPAEDPVHCPGSAESPEATPGWFCLYRTTAYQNVFRSGIAVLGRYGFVFRFTAPEPANLALAFGTWAVTASCEDEEPIC